MKKDDIVLTQEEKVQAVIDKSKKKYGHIYKTELADEIIIWRLLKRNEYKEIMNITIYKEVQDRDAKGNLLFDDNGAPVMKEVEDEEETFDARQEAIAKAVILYPDGVVDYMAAAADVISTECMLKSGFGDKNPKTERC
jgi:hypothetical protein